MQSLSPKYKVVPPSTEKKSSRPASAGKLVRVDHKSPRLWKNPLTHKLYRIEEEATQLSSVLVSAKKKPLTPKVAELA